MENDKNSRKYIDQYKTHFEDKRKEQKELMQTEFKEFHSINSGELVGYSITNMGATINEPTFEFETEYTIDGLVKKAGDNLILDADKLIGTQWVPSEKERIRNWDAYMSEPICIENKITIENPIVLIKIFFLLHSFIIWNNHKIVFLALSNTFLIGY